MNYELYISRALQLARCGEGNASPNPMVGAVIVDPLGQIIGEGYHCRCGEGHAEVNAVASVADEEALRTATMFVTLEPCSHYGKTPPCAKLIIDKQIPRVVVGTLDPFEKVSGRGVQMLRDAGVEVTVLDHQGCRDLNRRFFTAHTRRRPFVTLKWAQSADGFMDSRRPTGEPPYRFSTPLSTLAVHRLRSLHDAILTTYATVLSDNPRLNVRGWHGRQPLKVVLDRNSRLTGDENIFTSDGKVLHITDSLLLSDILERLYAEGVTSVLVEAGPTLLKEFIDAGLWDEARVEVAPVRLADRGAAPAPTLSALPAHTEKLGENTIFTFIKGF